MPEQSSGQPTLGRKRGSYVRLLIILGIAILAAITLRSLLALGAYIVSLIRGGAQWTGNFWSDQFPIIVLAAIVGLGAFGIYRLLRSLRK